MDKLKVYLAGLKKHHFWVLLAVVVIAGQATYLNAKWGLEKTFKDNKSKIDNAVNQLRDVDSKLQQGLQANEEFEKKVNDEQAKMQEQSFAIWQDSWDKQKPKLTWPEEPKVVAAIAELDQDKEIDFSVREAYMNNSVIPEWTKLLESVNLRRSVKPAGAAAAAPAPGLGGLGGAAGEKPEDMIGIVSWDKPRRDELIKRVTFQKAPSTVRVRVAQEDFWVYKALIDVVLAMNKGADDVLAASVKRIDRMDIAQWAIKYAQENPGVELGIKEAEGGVGGIGQDDARITPPDADKDISDEAILDNRYVDHNNRPVSAKAILNKTFDPSQPLPPFAEFRQMFVVMRLVMDQRRIPDLLTACANSSLPIETRQVMAHFADPLDAKPAQLDAAKAGVLKPDRGSFDAMVEVRGIVYLYNQPDVTKLGKGAAQNPARRSFGIPDRTLATDAAAVPADGGFLQ